MEKNGLLLVEGKDDLHVFSALAEIHNITETFSIKDTGGIERLFDDIPIVLSTARHKELKFDIERLGVVIDANNDISERWKSIYEILKAKGYPIENEILNDGLIIEDDSKEIPFVGVWIMPDNMNNGMLEDFFKNFIPEKDKLISKVNSCIDDVSKEPDLSTPTPRSKAEIRTWLAWQEKSESLMGYTLREKKEYLLVDNENAIKFIDWIKRLFQS